MDAKHVLLEKKGGIALVTLNRPDTMNTITAELAEHFSVIVRQLHEDKELRAVLITGAGDTAFCSGIDTRERSGAQYGAIRRALWIFRDAVSMVAELPVPVIAVVNGFAKGDGVELIMACDVRLIADSATLVMNEMNLAIIFGSGGAQRLSGIVGMAEALKLIISMEQISAGHALRLGLVDQVLQRQDLMQAARLLANRSDCCFSWDDSGVTPSKSKRNRLLGFGSAPVQADSIGV